MVKTKEAIEEPVQMTEQEKIKLLENQLADAKAKLAIRDVEIDNMKKKEEGWLVWTPSPLYNAATAGVLFTDGVAFIPKNRTYPRFVVEMPPPNTIRVMENDRTKYPNGIEELEIIKQSVAMPSSQRLVEFLVNDFGYEAEFFTKDQQDELQKRISTRARERAEAQAKLPSQSDLMDKLLVAHRM